MVFVAGVTACALPDAARRSSETLKKGWDFEANGLRALYTGPGATVMAAGDLALYSMRSVRTSSGEPDVKWFRFYDGPMRPEDEVAILCHLDSATHISSIRRIAEPVATEDRRAGFVGDHDDLGVDHGQYDAMERETRRRVRTRGRDRKTGPGAGQRSQLQTAQADQGALGHEFHARSQPLEGDDRAASRNRTARSSDQSPSRSVATTRG
jgi:hypothetical protein